MIKSAAIVRSATLLLALASWLVAILFSIAALHADATIPPGQVNESMLGYVMSLVLALTGLALLGVSRIYRNDRPAPSANAQDSSNGHEHRHGL
jgi:Ca2+/H+ antiporter